MAQRERRGSRTVDPEPSTATLTGVAGPDDDTAVGPVVDDGATHTHGHESHFHRGGPHWHDGSGHMVEGSWEPPDTLPYEYFGTEENPDDHRHNGGEVRGHPDGRLRHHHHPVSGHLIDLPTVTVVPPPADGQDEELAASMGRHPAGRQPAQDGSLGALLDAANAAAADRSPEEIEQLKSNLRRQLAVLDGSSPTPDRPPAIPAVANPAAGRLGTDLGGLELVKASFRAMFPNAPDGLDLEWALTMGASDLLGQMLNCHRRPAFSDPGLIADLRALVEQLDKAAAGRAANFTPDR